MVPLIFGKSLIETSRGALEGTLRGEPVKGAPIGLMGLGFVRA